MDTDTAFALDDLPDACIGAAGRECAPTPADPRRPASERPATGPRAHVAWPVREAVDRGPLPLEAALLDAAARFAQGHPG
jgi:hypothetical protein